MVNGEQVKVFCCNGFINRAVVLGRRGPVHQTGPRPTQTDRMMSVLLPLIARHGILGKLF